jgi:acetyl esterase
MERRMTEEYASRLDPGLWALIAETNRRFPPETATLDLPSQRRMYNELCRHFQVPYPENVASHDLQLDLTDHTLSARHYHCSASDRSAVILYFHGGGFVFGDLDSHGDICADICARTGFDVVSVDYRLAPEHPHPAAFEDSCGAFDWLAATTDRHILLCGESAGGNLAAAVAAKKRDHRQASVGQVLVYPSLGSDRTGASYSRHPAAPLLSVKDLDYYEEIRGGAQDRSDPTRDPLADTDFGRLPPTVIFTAECDPLSSEGEIYRDRLNAAGSKAAWIEGKELIHSFLRARHISSRAAQGFADICDAFIAFGAGRWPYPAPARKDALAAV